MKIGSLFSGVGGLDLAVEAFFGAETAWHCEWESEPSKVLAARWPGVPNFGDVTAVDWSTVEPVDILCGGFPCQDLSLAGRRSGMRPGTRSGLWSDFVRAIDELKPSVVVIENVRGLLSGCAESDSDVEPCPRCVAEGRGVAHAPRLRALGRVLGDLDRLGFDAEWHGLPASDVGAPHGRFRVFVLAYARGLRLGPGWDAASRQAAGGGASAFSRGRGDAHLTLLPTPTASEGEKGGPGQRHGGGDATLSGTAARLLPTPRAARGASGTETMYALGATRDDTGDRQGNVILLPTTTAGDAKSSRNSTATRHKIPPTGIHSGDTLTDAVVPVDGTALTAWGEYGPAVRLWESLTRPAPAPTLPDGKNGNHRLAAVFPEWMMGYPLGWVTDIIARNPSIKACGNGVVPQQAFAALGILWNRALEWMGTADVR